jgi:hypothetical protein
MERAPTLDAPADADAGISGARRVVVTGAILLALVMAAFEGTGVSGAMPTIAADLGGMGGYAWVFSAFLVASTLGVLTCGKLSDVVGRRPVFAAGVGLFLGASVLCAEARSIGELIAWRVLQGLGAGAIQPLAMTISADLYPLRERARIQALYTTVWGSANVLGPLAAGFIVMRWSWRGVFLVNVPFGVAATALVLAAYRDPPRARRGPSGVWGAVIAGLASGLALLALEPAGGIGGPGRAALAAGAALVTLALVRQQRASAAPILSAGMRASRVMQAGLLGGAFGGGLLYACVAYVPLWMTRQMHGDAVHASSALIPLLVGWSIGSTFGVHVLVHRGMRASVAGGFAIALAGAVGLAAAVAFRLPLPAALGALTVVGLGIGPAASTALIAPQTEAPWEERGMVTSVVYGSRMLGGSLMVAALGSAGAAEGAPPAGRFAAIALTALAAVVILASFAPGKLRAAR